LGNVLSHSVDASGNFVAGNARVLQPGEAGLLDHHVAVADAAGLDLDPYLGATGLRNRTLNYFPISAWFADLCRFHVLILRNGMRDEFRSRDPN
jgi:hypothetical protein